MGAETSQRTWYSRREHDKSNSIMPYGVRSVVRNSNGGRNYFRGGDMRYRVYISEVRSFTTEIDANSKAEADEIAENISMELSPTGMRFGDRYVEVERISL